MNIMHNMRSITLHHIIMFTMCLQEFLFVTNGILSIKINHANGYLGSKKNIFLSRGFLVFFCNLVSNKYVDL